MIDEATLQKGRDEEKAMETSSWPIHDCFWCGKPTKSPSWACRVCYYIKEDAYKTAREKGAKTHEEVYNEVYKNLEATNTTTKL